MAGRAYKRLEWSYPDTGQDQGAVYETDPPGEGLMPMWPPSPVPPDYVNTASIQDGAVTEPKLADQSVSNRTIVDFSVTTDKIGTEQVIGDKLADNSVTTPRIQNLAVTEPKLADNAVSERTVQDGAITGAKIANTTIENANIDDQTITNAKIDPQYTLVETQTRPADLVLPPTAADFNNLLTLLSSAHVLS